jgi:hypothetical protein
VAVAEPWSLSSWREAVGAGDRWLFYGTRYVRGWGEDAVGKELASGEFLAELVSLIRDDLLDTNIQKFEGRHVMAGDKVKNSGTGDEAILDETSEFGIIGIIHNVNVIQLNYLYSINS